MYGFTDFKKVPPGSYDRVTADSVCMEQRMKLSREHIRNLIGPLLLNELKDLVITSSKLVE